MDYKSILGAGAVLVAVISYIPYFRDIFAGKTKPHAFTWLVWASLNAIAFAGQIHDKGGAGAWAVGFTACALFAIFVTALFKGEKDIKRIDWICLMGAALALVLWFLTNGPLLSVILITIIDAFGFFPTVRKSYFKPHQETLVTFSLSIFKYFLVVLALKNYTPVTALFPVSLVVMNGLFVIMLVVRRRQLARA